MRRPAAVGVRLSPALAMVVLLTVSGTCQAEPLPSMGTAPAPAEVLRELNGSMPVPDAARPGDPCAGSWRVLVLNMVGHFRLFRYRGVALLHVTAEDEQTNLAWAQAGPARVRFVYRANSYVMTCAAATATIAATRMIDGQVRTGTFLATREDSLDGR